MFVQRFSVDLTTDASGDATGFIDVPYGRVLGLHYVKTDFADGVDFTITAEATGETIWTESNVNASAFRYPRAGVHGTDGVAAEHATGFPVEEPVCLAHDRIKIVVASGGNAKSGSFIAIIG